MRFVIEDVEGAVRRVSSHTWGLVSPRVCPCGESGVRVCRPCRAVVERAVPQRVDDLCDVLQIATESGTAELETGMVELETGMVELETGMAELEDRFTPLVPVWSLGRYEGRLRNLLLAWKNGGCFHLAPEVFAPALDRALDRVVEPGRAHIVVPAPSSWQARVRRGEDHMRDLARHIVRRRPGAVLGPSLGSVSSKQQGESARSRASRSLRHSRRRAFQELGHVPIVMVDDVVTTGATIRAMADVVAGSSRSPLVAITIASARWHR